MFCWHKWSKWSEVKYEKWEQQRLSFNYPVGNPIEYIRDYQERTCDKCGKAEKRYINE